MNEIELCLSEQRAFFQSGITHDVGWRKKQLLALRQALEKNEELLLNALTLDLGKTEFEGFATELGVVYGEIKHLLKHLDSWCRPHRVPTSLLNFPSRSFTLAQPLGVVLIMSPWNYPLQLTLAPLVAAMAAGNCAIVKPSRYSENTSRAIEKVLSQCFPSNYIATFQGGSAINTELLKHHFDHIFFTGGTTVGKIVMQAASNYLTPISLELGGKSPAIVDETANIKLAARRIAWGKCLNSGQTCVAPDYVLVKREILPVFVDELKKAIQEMFGTEPLYNKDFPKIINQKHFTRLISLLSCGTLAYGGQIDPESLKIAPTILTNPDMDSPLMTDEIFGPILPIIGFDSFEQATDYIRDREHPLALYLFSNDKKRQKWVVSNLIYGGGCINDTVAHLANPSMAFGGVGGSGMGSYHAKESFTTFSHTKSILNKRTWLDIKIRYAPYKGKLSLVKRLMH
ncbi:aldehyde dehydrogenase [uncultured Sphaerochaeta sp.]|uniref:aldehyde dehydrogenase n=1 Tax=uncultured Sphaerochaeta sp. TaxID=886478 RepID=UPI002A0A6CC3|nr:aldehyde dehydrogenase [uncultured Sphaerochaeta sp.]